MHVTADTVTNPGYQHTHILYSRVPSITGGIKMTATLPPSGLQVSLYQSFLFLSLFRCVCVYAEKMFMGRNRLSFKTIFEYEGVFRLTENTLADLQLPHILFHFSNSQGVPPDQQDW